MSSGSPSAPTVQRRTAEALVGAFNEMDVEAIMSHRDENCTRIFLPASMGLSPQSNATYRSSLQKLRAIFLDFSLIINDLLEDKEKRRICMWLSARADTVVGKYVNEYMWLYDFDEHGKILVAREFSDSVMEREFFPKLRAAMDRHQAEQLDGMAKSL